MPRKPKISLTRLEGEVMRAVWDGEPEAVCVRDVLEALNARRTPPLAYNTIQTILTILRDKKIVKVVKGEGRAHYYRARVSRSDASRHMVDDLVDRLFDGRVQPLLQQLIDDDSLDADDLSTLRNWVDSRLRDTEGDQR